MVFEISYKWRLVIHIWNLRNSVTFSNSGAFCEIPRKFCAICTEKWPNQGNILAPQKIWIISILVKIIRQFENWCEGLQNSTVLFEELHRSRKMLKNAPTLASGGVHTAENEPPKELRICRMMPFLLQYLKEYFSTFSIFEYERVSYSRVET